MAAYIDHAAYKVENLEWYIHFFDAVFQMTVYREQTGPDGLRKVWLVGGVQLCEVKEPCTQNGRTDHLCLIVDDLEGARGMALSLGCKPLPKHHWVELPDGLKVEMFPALPGVVQTLADMPKH